MAKGMNQNTTRLVIAGLLCYRCHKAIPTVSDEYGKLCKPCYDEMQKLIKVILLRDGGYRQR